MLYVLKNFYVTLDDRNSLKPGHPPYTSVQTRPGLTKLRMYLRGNESDRYEEGACEGESGESRWWLGGFGGLKRIWAAVKCVGKALVNWVGYGL